jgi:mono/diheme cytochrome c family protein
MTLSIRISKLLLAGALAMAACATEQEQTSPELAQQAAPLQGRVPVKMRAIQLRAPMVERGKTLFVQCAACHGPHGEGVLGVGPRLDSESFLAAASDDFLVRTISLGRPGTTMVSWGHMMSADDIYAVTAYIRSWNPVRPATLDESPLQGDAERGQEIFITVCASCHGRSGAGYQETANGSGIGRKVFLDEVSNGYLRYIVKHGKTQTTMKGFKSRAGVANLGDQEIEDVITYLRLNAW